MTTVNTIALTILPIVSKLMSQLLICSLGLSWLFSQGASLLISWLQSLCTVILEPKKIKSVTVTTSPLSICHKVMGPDSMILVFFLLLSYKPAFSFSSFTLIKRLFSSFSLFTSRLASAYLRLLIFIPAILILACESFSPAFHMIYFACKLNNRVTIYSLDMPLSNFWTSLFVPCPVLTVTSCPAYRFLRRQIRWSDIHISLRIFHSLLWSTQSKFVLAHPCTHWYI